MLMLLFMITVAVADDSLIDSFMLSFIPTFFH